MSKWYGLLLGKITLKVYSQNIEAGVQSLEMKSNFLKNGAASSAPEHCWSKLML